MVALARIQQSRRFAQAFGRCVYADILRWGESELLSLLCRTYQRKSDDTFMDCLRRFYYSLKKSYRCEYVFKNEIIAELAKEYSHRKSLIVNEFHVGNSIADLAFFNGESRAYEIKTSYDTPRRLRGQLQDYRRVFDKCYLVIEQSDIDDWMDYDDDMGILAFCHSPRGKITFEEVRPAKLNKRIDIDVLMTCLRAEEYESIAVHFADAHLSESKHKHFEECKAVMNSMDNEVVRSAFLETIEKRKSSFDLLRQTPHELYQICMSMHLTGKQLGVIINCLNNKIN